MALVDNTIQKFVESNYPAIKSVLRQDDKLLLECGLCGKQLKIDAFDRVGMSINSYASGLIRQVMDRHVLIECLKIREERASRQGTQYVTSGRKITLED